MYPLTASRPLVTNKTAADSGNLGETEFVGGNDQGTRIFCALVLSGTGALEVTLQPVIRRPRQAGADIDAAGVNRQYVSQSQEWTVDGTTEISDYAWFDVPRGWEFGMRVTAISGTGATVSVVAQVEE